MVGLAGVVVQLSAQLVGDERQEHVSTVCGGTERRRFLFMETHLTSFWTSLSPFFWRGESLCEVFFLLLFFPTWLPEKVALHHFTHAAQLLTHELRVRNAFNELRQEDAADTMKEEVARGRKKKHLVITVTEG